MGVHEGRGLHSGDVGDGRAGNTAVEDSVSGAAMVPAGPTTALALDHTTKLVDEYTRMSTQGGTSQWWRDLKDWGSLDDVAELGNRVIGGKPFVVHTWMDGGRGGQGWLAGGTSGAGTHAWVCKCRRGWRHLTRPWRWRDTSWAMTPPLAAACACPVGLCDACRAQLTRASSFTGCRRVCANPVQAGLTPTVEQ